MTEPCSQQLVLLKLTETQGEFRGIISGMATDISEIKARVNNGLTQEIKEISRELSRSITDGKAAAAVVKSDAKTTAIEVKAEVDLAAERIRGENWLARIMTGSAKQLIGIGIVVVVSTAITTTGLGLLAKSQISKEPAGQQQQIMQKASAIQSTLGSYHFHYFEDGRILSHTGDSTSPALLYNPSTNTWDKVPAMRTENNIKQ